MKLPSHIRRGVSLLELIAATAILTTVMTAVVVLVRTSNAAWIAYEQDSARIENAQAAVRHVVRHLRQAEQVLAISPPGDLSGTLRVLMPSGETLVWTHDATNDRVNFGVGVASDWLAETIIELSFTGYEADGVTPTADPADTQLVVCSAVVELPRGTGERRTVTSRGWLRAW